MPCQNLGPIIFIHTFLYNMVSWFIESFFGGLMKTPMLSSAGFVCLRVGYRQVFWEEFSRLT